MRPKSFHIGEMRQIIKFEANAPTGDEGGGEEELYTEFLSTWGRLRKKSGFRSLEQGDILLNSGYELICRFQSALENELSTDIRIVSQNRFFQVESWEKIEEVDGYYRFQLTEGQKH